MHTATTSTGWTVEIGGRHLDDVYNNIVDDISSMAAVGLPAGTDCHYVEDDDLDSDGWVTFRGAQYYVEAEELHGMDKTERTLIDFDALSKSVTDSVMRCIVDPASVPMRTILTALENAEKGVMKAVYNPEILSVLDETGLHLGIVFAAGVLGLEDLTVRKGDSWWQISMTTIHVGGEVIVGIMANTDHITFETDFDDARVYVGIGQDLPETVIAQIGGRHLRDVVSDSRIDHLDIMIDEVVQQDGYLGRIYVKGLKPRLPLMEWVGTRLEKAG